MLAAYTVFCVLIITLGLFIWGYWRYDVVAFFALMSLVIIGIIPASEAFTGFSNPAVITVACVMVITQALSQSGVVDHIVNKLTPMTNHETLHLSSLVVLTAILSAFMNNIGALALMMPVAIQTANQANRSPSTILMPLAFGSVLGGLTTAIGTPPNLLISAFRLEKTGHPFAMFDFAPVGVVVAVAAIIYIVLFGWRLIPVRIKPSKKQADFYHIQDYITEIKVPKDCAVDGMKITELDQLTEAEFTIIGLIRGKRRQLVIGGDEILQANDILIVEATHDELQKIIDKAKLEVIGDDTGNSEILRSGDIDVMEVVVPPGSRLEKRSWQRMRIRSRFRINLLAIARQGRAFNKRLNHVDLKAGDVLLLQGNVEDMLEEVIALGLVPLAERDIKIGARKKAYIPLLIFIGAIVLSALKLLTVEVAFAAAVLLLVLLNVMPIRRIYTAIDWSIVVLLAAMIPVGGALQATGGTIMIANMVMGIAGHVSPLLIIALLLVVTMTLSDIMNNAATAVVMAPIAVSIATALNASVDPFLMTVAIGASCSFLTPISHQNNTLVMGPGGYEFSDYWRLGLPVEIIVLMFALPMIMMVWPI